MALINCRECSKEISNEAAKCPHCGAARKQSHGFGTIFVVAVIAFVGIWIFKKVQDNDPTTIRGSIALATQEALSQTTVKSLRWWRDGFDTILMTDLVIENKGKHAIRDFEVRCSGFAPSGTRIDGNKQVVYDSVGAGKSKSFKKVNMGFLHGQVKSVGCHVSKVALVPNVAELAAKAGLVK